MRRSVFAGILLLALIAFLYGAYEWLRPPKLVITGAMNQRNNLAESALSLAKRVQTAAERAERVKALYMTGMAANDRGPAAASLRNEILRLIDTTEINSVVIDVKEAGGSEVTDNLQPLVEDLKKKGVWTIARIAVFRDNSQVGAHSEYYLKDKTGGIWRDAKGNAWLDPMNRGARLYLAQFSKYVADIGFDELQYDYIRFPSDGSVHDIEYPDYNSSLTAKPAALKDFFAFIRETMKAYKPELILSADLFGYVAIDREDAGIGQRLEDASGFFDYISPMIYPSHFYGGFYVPADFARDLPELSLPYESKNSSETAAAHPYDVVLRALYRANDILAGRDLATSTAAFPAEPPRAKLRPWLQDFDLNADAARGIYYGAKEVRDEIDAAEKAGAAGWILWSPGNTYTAGALRKE